MTQVRHEEELEAKTKELEIKSKELEGAMKHLEVQQSMLPADINYVASYVYVF